MFMTECDVHNLCLDYFGLDLWDIFYHQKQSTCININNEASFLNLVVIFQFHQNSTTKNLTRNSVMLGLNKTGLFEI